ncbi:AfsR/SARP family transcriptional regulator [Actinomadura kijaniata]|uniref:AfsR/SARP family transcriptional regulator n=1 Tax=Actinomadura kijaniata TaxID=46161 RepID=UPI000830026C|nr:AfsR/SARP family transcriptional regulator [Actinomadura kijaniata]
MNDGRELAVSLLGPLEVRRGRTPVGLTAGRLRTLLAALALSAGDTVSVKRLALALWGEDFPANARRGVHTYVARLRRVLGPDAVRTMPDGYRLDADPDRIDVLRFRRLLAEAGRARGTAAERAALEEALALWRGPPFEGVDSDWLGASESACLLESYLGAVERRIDLDLAEGRHGEPVAELMELTARHPLRESLWGRLLVALGRCGRQAEALAHYERLRRHLVEELGTEPSAELRHIYDSLLHLGTPSDHRVPAVPERARRRMAVFAGHVVDLAQADGLAAADVGERFAGVCVVPDAADGNRPFLAVFWKHRQ